MKRLSVLPFMLLAPLAQADVLDRQVEDFDLLQSSGHFDISWQPGTVSRLRAEGDPDLLKRLQIENSGARLELKLSKTLGSLFSSDRKLKITLTSPSLKQAELSGVGNMNIQGVDGSAFTASLSGVGNITLNGIHAGGLDVELSGVGDISATGEVSHLRARLSGVGHARLVELKAKEAEATLSGVGNLKLLALDKATLQCSGSGSIRLAGSPAQKDLRSNHGCPIRAL